MEWIFFYFEPLERSEKSLNKGHELCIVFVWIFDNFLFYFILYICGEKKSISVLKARIHQAIYSCNEYIGIRLVPWFLSRNSIKNLLIRDIFQLWTSWAKNVKMNPERIGHLAKKWDRESNSPHTLVGKGK